MIQYIDKNNDTIPFKKGNYVRLVLPLGEVLVATLQDAIGGLYFIRESKASSFHRLQRDWPGVDWQESKDTSLGLAKSVNRYFKNKELGNLKLVLKGTAFQLKVWKALLSVPWGEQLTYSELAARVGASMAVRAVGTAVGANPISILVPCHRILPKAGGVGGYAWGSDIKRLLLELEAA